MLEKKTDLLQLLRQLCLAGPRCWTARRGIGTKVRHEAFAHGQIQRQLAQGMAGLAQLSLRNSSSALLLRRRFVCRLERRGGGRISTIRRLPLAPAQSRSDA